MLKTVLIVALTILAPAASVYGQVCSAYGNSETVFVGRAEAPLTFHMSGEREIERARQTLMDTEAEVARLKSSLDFWTRMERHTEFEMRLTEARTELQMRRDMYPSPYDLTVIPVSVERAFRGVTEPTVMVLQKSRVRMEPGELYLIGGGRSNNLMPPFPEMSDLVTFVDYVETQQVTPVAAAQQELALLASPAPGATIVGELRMQTYSDGMRLPLGAVRIVVSSGTDLVETTTTEDGSFALSGIAPGLLDIMPLLPEDLTIVNKSALTVQVEERGCAALPLTAELNGRLRGRIISATGNSLEGVQLVLHAVDSSGHPRGSRSPRTTVRPDEDGRFEFSGQPPGSYVLSVWVETIADGTRRYLTTFYPGTHDLAAAAPIVIGRATQHDGFDFLVTTE